MRTSVVGCGKNMKNKTSSIVYLTNDHAPALECMHLVAEIARESLVMLDTQFRVLSANQAFCQTFLIAPEQAEHSLIYRLGNGAWQIPKLKMLLETILPAKHAVINYELTHVFKTLGKKTLLINAIQVDAIQAIILAIDDITPHRELEKKFTEFVQMQQVKTTQQVSELMNRVKELEALNKAMVGRELKMLELKKEIARLKKPHRRVSR